MGLNELIKIGDRIKSYRKNLKLTQAEMADKLNLPRSTYAHYENNTREPKGEILKNIADILGVSEFDLIYDRSKLSYELDEYEKKEFKDKEDHKKLYEKISLLLEDYYDCEVSEYEEPTEDFEEPRVSISNFEDDKIEIEIEQSKFIELGKKMIEDIEQYKLMRVLYFLKEITRNY